MYYSVAYNSGWLDFEDGYYLDENPYYWGTWAYEEWKDGWLDARDDYYGYYYYG